MWSGGVIDPATASRAAARANSDLISAENEAEGARNALQSSERAAEQSDNNYRGEEIKLNPSRWQVSGLFDMARFRQWMFEREYISKQEIAMLQIIGQNQNFGGACLLSFWGIRSRMSAAITGNTSRASGELYLKEYFRPDAPSKNQAPETFAEANSQLNTLRSQEDALARNKARDKEFNSQRVGEDQAKQDKKDRELAEAKVELPRAEQTEKDANAAANQAHS